MKAIKRNLVTLQATDSRASFAGNTHRVVLNEEPEVMAKYLDCYVGWPDPADARNSDVWKPGQGFPLVYPKFAWKEGGSDELSTQ